jgi:late competence protein required for DNA uptake (superfamily II DNA/RNA helicase)
MSREKLREAIEIYWHVTEDFPNGPLARVIAAAKAYACERCGGTGAEKRFSDDAGLSYHHCVLCPDCAEFRRIADGGGE